MPAIRVMLVAGEPSGDQLGAKLVEALRVEADGQEIEFFGAAGVRMRNAGVQPVVDSDGLAIMGITEIARSFPVFLRAFRRLRSEARERRPDVVVLIDFPDFNLKLAKALKKDGLRVVYYVSPQLWGWREYRLRTIRDHVDLLLTILPFEEEWYARNGVTNVKYIGHPLVENVKPSMSGRDFRVRYSLSTERPMVALLPGSREKEVSRILPPMIEAAAILSAREPEAQFTIALASTRTESEVTDAIRKLRDRFSGPIPELKIVKDETYDVLNAADAAAVASGTATLEAGILGTPMAIVYKASAINYRLVRPLIKVEHFGLINLIAGRRVATELIQNDFTPEKLSDELRSLLDPIVNKRIRDELSVAVERLGPGGGSERAAKVILDLINRPA